VQFERRAIGVGVALMRGMAESVSARSETGRNILAELVMAMKYGLKS